MLPLIANELHRNKTSRASGHRPLDLLINPKVVRLPIEQGVRKHKVELSLPDRRHRLQHDIPKPAGNSPNFRRQTRLTILPDKRKDEVVDRMIVDQPKVSPPANLPRHRKFPHALKADEIEDAISEGGRVYGFQRTGRKKTFAVGGKRA